MLCVDCTVLDRPHKNEKGWGCSGRRGLGCKKSYFLANAASDAINIRTAGMERVTAEKAKQNGERRKHN